jgi:hypothetical protein
MTDWNRVAAAVLAKCASKDPFFPKPSPALALGWGEEFERWNLTADDLLAGVTKAYSDNGSGFRPLPKDIVDAARAIRRDRSERESDEERRAREARNDVKVLSDEQALRLIARRTGQRAPGREIGEAS